ncbi:MAG: class I adenylate-forming enzyme family protein [Chloroflexi bacterium]|nr:class I adenylate-forming enzyme family protein [Chloroflexota bacterium]
MTRTTPELIESAARSHGDAVAVYQESGDHATFAYLNALSNKMAVGLADKGVQSGDYIGIVFSGSRWIDCAAAYFAVHRLGGIVVLLPHPDFVDRGGTTGGEISVDFSKLKNFSIIAPEDVHSELPGVAYTGQWIADPCSLIVSTSRGVTRAGIRPNEIAEIAPTSGTTGRARAIAASHDNITFKSRYSISLLDEFTSNTFDMPVLLHCSGAFAPRLGDVVHPFRRILPNANFQTVVVMHRFNPESFCHMVSRHNVTHSAITPPQGIALLSSRLGHQADDMSSLQLLEVGDSHCPTSLWPRLQKTFPSTKLVNTYGISELGPPKFCHVIDVNNLPPLGLVGQGVPCVDKDGGVFAVPEVRIVKSDGKEAPEGEAGDIWMRCRGMPGREYFQDKTRQAKVYLPDEWVVTGDFGYQNSEGQVTLLDRRDDNIVRGLQAISSTEVEDIFYEHSEVKRVAAFSVPDPVLGEEVAVAVVAHDRRRVKVSELKRFARERARHPSRVPRMIFVVDSLPENRQGKILKRRLREVLRNQFR